jgi:hypothetical protein
VDAADPFGTAELRRTVLDGWRASPARFREDANAEEDYALGAYRDRLVVELAQNAADAAVRSGAPGRLRLTLATTQPDASVASAGWELVAANTGAPLDAEGVVSLSTLRASAKRDDDAADTVGRYGVGFAAVLDVTDEPAVLSTSGGVRWSRSRTAAAVAELPELADEVSLRDGHVPVLRLPWPDDAKAPAGADTAVVLPLRDAAAVERVRAALAEVDAALLLMLPGLAEVVVEDGSGPGGARTLRRSDLDVVESVASGPLDPALLADRPAEERRVRTWSVRWAFPRPAGTTAVLHAPTPTDEPVELPALLVASFPLEPGRRHVATGPLADLLVERAAQAYVDHVRDVAREPGAGPDSVLALVPGPLAAGPLDARLREAIVDRLASAPVLPGGVPPAAALAVDGLPDDAVDALADAIGGLLPAAWAARRELDRLGVRRLRLTDLVDDLAALDRPATWWQRLYDALETVRASDLDALSGLPVPLADGRLVRGARRVLVGATPEEAQELAALGLRVAATGVGGELLTRLGALGADPGVLLEQPEVRAAVEASLEADDPGLVADAVLGLVRDAGVSPGELPWLSHLALADDEDAWSPAGDLLLPDGPLAALVEPGALGVVDPATVEQWGTDVLEAAGALATFGVVRETDVLLDVTTDDHDLDGEADWLDAVLATLDIDDGDTRTGGPGAAVLVELVAVRDLDLVADDRWPAALSVLAADPELRAAVVTPARVVRTDGRVEDVEPYTAWWLRTHPVLGGSRPDHLRGPGADALVGVLDAAPDLGLDDAFLRAIGVVTSVADVASTPMVVPLLLAGVNPDAVDAEVDGDGVRRPVPAVAASVLGTDAVPPGAYVEHDDLRVAGVAVEWWVDDDGVVHAATLDGLARGLAWVTDRWERRWALAAVLVDPDRLGDVLAEDAWS